MEVYGLDYLKVKEVIGKPYSLEAKENTFNCWSLINYLFPHSPSYDPLRLREYIELFNSKTDEMLVNVWGEVKEPLEGDIVLFAKTNYYSHAGVYLSNERILHASQVGVVVESFDMLKLQYKNKRFYRWQ